ncbi:tRNA (adenosine(37)-N6)-threonylcarbamoyltransferase complex transferase subunit TsaD [Patescibacteria group bacterium]|nr:tRNA (adenosine(37)-N6)-threonylcarbamoyltransferase complex transferase subunit TsaD [Patescibacteria group bacterium]
MKRLRVLGIETSCDETSVAILEVGKSVRLVHHETATQIPIHARYGGVVPEVAARTHVAELVSLLERAKAFGPKPRFDAVAVTRGPGLATALRVGLEAGRTIAAVRNVPIVGVNHLEGHLASTWLVPENRKGWKFPILFLLVSGGHSELILMRDFNRYKVLGRTRDDAAGEAFDKMGKLMGLGYPGGPALAKLALKGDPTSFDLPRPMLNDPSLDMSFSGLKTAVLREWQNLPKSKRKEKVADLSASIQTAIVDVLVKKALTAAKKSKPVALAIVGGVSANQHLQQEMSKAVARELPNVRMLAPSHGFHTDNAAMIAAAGAWRLTAKPKGDNWKTLSADPELDF